MLRIIQSGLIDMSGPGAEFTLFSKKLNVVLVMGPKEGFKENIRDIIRDSLISE